MAQFTDGTSNTLLCAEVKSWQPYVRNGGPPKTDIPNTVDEAAAMVASGAEYKTTGHTEWPDGRVHHTGITATMRPNTYVPYSVDGARVDADYNSWQEGKNGIAGSPTYAIVTARSHHSGLVEVGLVDGSVQTVADTINIVVWRAIATRKGNETLTGEFQK